MNMSRRIKIGGVLSGISIILAMAIPIVSSRCARKSMTDEVLSKTREYKASISAYSLRNNIKRPIELSELIDNNVLSKTDVDFILSNQIAYYPWEDSDSDDKVVFEYRGRYRRLIVLKSGKTISKVDVK